MSSPSSLKFKNASLKSIKVILEPWADEYCIEPGSTIEVISDGGGRIDKEIEVEFYGEDITIHGWSDNISVLIKHN